MHRYVKVPDSQVVWGCHLWVDCNAASIYVRVLGSYFSMWAIYCLMQIFRPLLLYLMSVDLRKMSPNRIILAFWFKLLWTYRPLNGLMVLIGIKLGELLVRAFLLVLPILRVQGFFCVHEGRPIAVLIPILNFFLLLFVFFFFFFIIKFWTILTAFDVLGLKGRANQDPLHGLQKRWALLLLHILRCHIANAFLLLDVHLFIGNSI